MGYTSRTEGLRPLGCSLTCVSGLFQNKGFWTTVLALLCRVVGTSPIPRTRSSLLVLYTLSSACLPSSHSPALDPSLPFANRVCIQ